MRFAIEQPVIKTAIILAGIPITALALLGLIDSLGLLLGGIQHNDPWPITFGIGAFLSFVGIIGAWKRIIQPYASLTAKHVTRIRQALFAGIAGGSLLAIGTLGIFSSALGLVAGAFLLLSCMGALLILQTPIKP